MAHENEERVVAHPKKQTEKKKRPKASCGEKKAMLRGKHRDPTQRADVGPEGEKRRFGLLGEKVCWTGDSLDRREGGGAPGHKRPGEIMGREKKRKKVASVGKKKAAGRLQKGVTEK